MKNVASRYNINILDEVYDFVSEKTTEGSYVGSTRLPVLLPLIDDPADLLAFVSEKLKALLYDCVGTKYCGDPEKTGFPLAYIFTNIFYNLAKSEHEDHRFDSVKTAIMDHIYECAMHAGSNYSLQVFLQYGTWFADERVLGLAETIVMDFVTSEKINDDDRLQTACFAIESLNTDGRPDLATKRRVLLAMVLASPKVPQMIKNKLTRSR